MEIELGETFIWNNQKLEVAEVEDFNMACRGCYFFENEIPCFGNGLDCTDDARRDHTNVIFKNSTKSE